MNLKKVIIGIAILILTIFVTVYGINAFYAQPEYEDFCKIKPTKIINTEQGCILAEGKWNYYENQERFPEITKKIPTGYCEINYKCRTEYDSARKIYSRNVFFIALPLSIIILALGAFLFQLETVGAGLMGGGVGTLIYGTWGFFWQTSDKIRFVISLIGLIILIVLAYHFNAKFEHQKVYPKSRKIGAKKAKKKK